MRQTAYRVAWTLDGHAFGLGRALQVHSNDKHVAHGNRGNLEDSRLSTQHAHTQTHTQTDLASPNTQVTL